MFETLVVIMGQRGINIPNKSMLLILTNMLNNISFIKHAMYKFNLSQDSILQYNLDIKQDQN